LLPEAVLDLDGDGVLELLGGESLLRRDAKGYNVQDLPLPFLCDC
jgi:hypothetical protein